MTSLLATCLTGITGLVVLLHPTLPAVGNGPAGGPSPLLHAVPASPAAVWPLDPPSVVHGFSPPPEPWAAGHRGVDLLGEPGQLVRSAQAGTVVFAGSVAGVGVVVVRHGPTRSTYEPVAASVHSWQHVDAGQPLGRLTLFGSHCFPRACLHWGLLHGERYLDPLGLLGAAPVRLLPFTWRPLLPHAAVTKSGVPQRVLTVAGEDERRQARGWA